MDASSSSKLISKASDARRLSGNLAERFFSIFAATSNVTVLEALRRDCDILPER